MTKILPFAYPYLFENYLAIGLTFYEQSIVKVVGGFYYFSLEVIRKTTINQL